MTRASAWPARSKEGRRSTWRPGTRSRSSIPAARSPRPSPSDGTMCHRLVSTLAAPACQHAQALGPSLVSISALLGATWVVLALLGIIDRIAYHGAWGRVLQPGYEALAEMLTSRLAMPGGGLTSR